ncbi:ABC transporter permease [Silvibacterium acidisoli]|uniref:ABC transporter permease n=1 Tax=Acidobacteriaceae bacterium ZG23-2 TaxID=2883246 RepID=UPI00406BF80E
MINVLMQNLRYALRQLRKSPGFTFTVVLTLALGIGANAAVFSLFDQVLLRVLPVDRPNELVRFEWTGGFNGSISSFAGTGQDYFSYPLYKDLRDQNRIFQGVIGAEKTNVALSWHNQAEDVDSELVTGNYFQMLGLRSAFGRLFTAQDETAPGANPVAILSYDYWKSHFSASKDVVGQSVLINGHPFTIVGVGPPNFISAIGGYKPGVFLPVTMVDIAVPWASSQKRLSERKTLWMVMMARLKPGVSVAQAQAALEPWWHAQRASEFTAYSNVSARFRQRFVEDSRMKVLDDSKGFSITRQGLQSPLIILMCMAGLLVAMCAINVATLLLLRAVARAREIAMRYALGSGRGRIVGQLLTEGLLLGITGAIAGLALAPMLTGAMTRLLIQSTPGSEPYSSAVDMRVLFFTLLISVTVSVLFSIAPIAHFLRPDLAVTLRQNSGTASISSQRFRKIAVGVQIALCVLLLGGAGLFVRTLDNLRRENVGFQTSNLVTFELDPTSSGYNSVRTAQTIKNSLETLERIPGVQAAAGTTDPELSGDSSTTNFTPQGYTPGDEEKVDFEAPSITPRYFETLQQPMLAGRDFNEADIDGKQRVAIVNLSFAKKFFGSPQDALGRLLSDSGAKAQADIQIVGVVGDTRHSDIRTPVGPAVYRPYLQLKQAVGLQMYVRTSQAPNQMLNAVRESIHNLDPMLVVDGLRTMQAQIDISAGDERALAILAIGFSALAMVLAAVGLYGVLAYSTEQRTREIGVRLALGAQRSGVVGLVMREMAIIALIAIVVAIPSIVLLAHFFRTLLYGVSSADPATMIGVLGLTVMMVCLAAVLPARKAASINPSRALRID